MSTPFYDLASLVVVPSGYKASKVYAQKPLTTDGQLTFSRASTATRVNSAGLIETVSSNVPRLDYLGSTCPKLQLEPQRTNSLELSENLGAYPLFNMTAATSSVTSPDGGTNAWRLTSTAAFGVLYSPRTVTGAQTLSVFCKYVSAANMRVGFTDFPTDYETVFNVQNGTIVSSTAGITGKIEAYPNGWYRCSVTRTIAGATANIYFGATASGGVYDFFGAQLEGAAYSTSYIKTTGAAVTRLADLTSKTGISSLIGQTEGTIFAEIEMVAGNGQILILTSAAGNEVNRVQLYIDANRKIGLYRGDASVNIVSANAYAVGTTLKIAAVYKANDYALYVNGVSVGTDTSATAPVTPAVLYLGQYVDGSKTTTISAKQAILFKTRLPNAQLAELTSL